MPFQTSQTALSVLRHSALVLAAVTQSCQFRILSLGFCWKCLRSVTERGRIQNFIKSSKVYSLSCVYEYSCFAAQVHCEYAGAIQMANTLKEENKYCNYYCYYCYWSLYKSAIKKSLEKFGFNKEQIPFTSESRMLTDVCEEVYMQREEGLLALMLILGKYILFCSFLDFYQ